MLVTTLKTIKPRIFITMTRNISERKKTMEFAVVSFPEEGEVIDVIPSNWIIASGNLCLYPNVVTDLYINKLVSSQQKTSKDWRVVKIKVLKSYESYEAGKKYLEELPSPLTNPHLQTPTTCEERVQKVLSESTFKKNIHPPSPSQSLFEYVSTDSLEDKPPASPSLQPCSGGSSQESFVTKELLSLKHSQEMMGVMMEGFSEKLDSILALLTKMEAEKKVENSTKRLGSYPENGCPDLPIEKDKFMDFEDRLQDPTFRSNIVRVLGFSDGMNLRTFATNVMRSLISNELAEEYSLTGKKCPSQIPEHSHVNKSFLATKSFELVMGVCRHKFQYGSESTVRSAVSEYLSQAKHRRLKRERRKEELNKKSHHSSDDLLNESELSISSFLNETEDETL